jgi:hypothetical protein
VTSRENDGIIDMKATISLNLEQIEEVYSALNHKAVYYHDMAEKQESRTGRDFYRNLWDKTNDILTKVYDAEIRLKRKGS